MKRNLILTFLACGASVMLTAAAQAQDATPTPAASPSGSPGAWVGHKHGEHGGPGGHGGLLQHLTGALSLSGSQQAQIAPILEAAKPQMKAIRDEAQAKRKALIDSVSTQITPLLTADQQAKFAEMVQKFEAGPGPGPGGPRHFGKRGGPEGPGPLAKGEILKRLTTQLNLTADQQTQIKPILEAAHTQMQSVRQDTTLTPAQKFAKVKETMEGVHSQINGILTPAQQQQLAALKEKFHHGRGPGAQPSASPSPAAN